MIFDKLKKNKAKYDLGPEYKKRFFILINPHLPSFQKIIKSVINDYSRFNRKYHYEIDDRPRLSISDDGSTIGCALTFTSSWDICKDECNSQIPEVFVVNKIFEMEDKIIKELEEYCSENNLKVQFTNNSTNWDDAGIYCSINVEDLRTD